MQTSRLRSILFAAVAAASLGASVAQAESHSDRPQNWHQWHRGDRYYGPRHVVTHWDHYNLPRPPHGSIWVQEGPQFVLLGHDGFVTRVWGH
jgi:Ni/Co efflux regulator RcnB